MGHLFPEPSDEYPVVHIEDTDAPLSEHVVGSPLRYTHFRTVARGGKCVIQSCRDTHLRRSVAMKTLRKELKDDVHEQRRFLREARVSAMLQHPGSVPIYELSRNNHGQYYFTMKLIAGETLREVIDASRESERYYIADYGLDRIVTILIQVGDVLDYAHHHGVLHRDVKPGNILMGRFGEVILLDWGLAKVWTCDESAEEPPDEEPPDEDPPLLGSDPSLTGQGKLQGTAPYMSPEQIERSSAIDQRTDVYSLGAVLYESLTLKQMIEGADIHDICENARTVMPLSPSLRARDRAIPRELDDICMRCVQKDPADRYPSVNKLVTELRAWRGRRVRA